MAKVSKATRRTTRRSGGRLSVRVEPLEGRRLLAAATAPIIGEFLASNQTGLADVDGDRSDWIEIYNPTAAAVGLGGWRLTDDPASPAQWTFPAVSLAAGGRLVVFASDKDRRDPAGELHTNFKLSADGEYLALAPPGGSGAPTSVFNPFPPQAADVSYGPPGADPAAARYFSHPTPGAPNDPTTLQVVADTSASVGRGFFDQPFQVALTTATAGASIRYTIDGTPPSATHGTPYSGPITVSGTTTLRSVAYKPGYVASRVGTQTYLFLDQVIHQPAQIPGWPNPTVPIGRTLTRTHDYEMDPAVVNDPAYAGSIKKGLTDIPTMSLVVDLADMWDAAGNGGFYRLSDVERPVSVEVMYAHAPQKNVQVDAGVEGHSDDHLKRSLRLDFRSEYGTPRFRTSLLQDGPVGGSSATNEFSRLVLRGGHNRSWAFADYYDQTTYAEDEFVRETQVAMSGSGVHGTFVHLYINGLYWGLYNAVERPDKYFTSTYFGGNAGDWAAVSHEGVKDGDPTRWWYLRNKLTAKDMSVLSNYRELEQYLDVTNFSDYLLGQFYAGVTDWPDNNWWGGNRNDVPGPMKFLSWDGEYSFGIGSGKLDSPPHAWVSPLFRRDQTIDAGEYLPRIFNSAKASPEFRIAFADRAYRATANGGALTDAAAQARWDALTSDIRDAVIAESARWGDTIDASRPRTRDGVWQAEANRIRAYMTGNAAQLIAALRAEGYYPATNPPTFGRRGGAVPAGFGLTLNNSNGSGTIYYTLDGSDPRAAGGALSVAAKAYGGSPVVLAAAGTTRVRARVLRGGEWSAGDDVTFTVTADSVPIIWRQPADRSVSPGQPATFSVGASGAAPLRYQWQRNAADIPGATADTYTLASVSEADDGAVFRVIVSNAHGTITSDPARLTMSTGPIVQTYEAELAARSGAVVDQSRAGFTGTGYVDYLNATGDYVEFTPDAAAAGDCRLAFRYANGSTADRPLELRVNGVVVNAKLSFPATGSWSSYATVTVTVSLAAGANRVRLTAAGQSGPNLDALTVTPVEPPAAITLQAEDAARAGATVASNNGGFTGGFYVDYLNATGDYVEFTADVPAAGTYDLAFRYANGATADRPLRVSVNGAVVSTSLSFAPTGSWSVWRTSLASAVLAAGPNKIRLAATGASGPNLDALTLTPRPAAALPFSERLIAPLAGDAAE